MRSWRRNAALVTAAALIAGGCSTPRTATPSTPAVPAQAPAGLVSVTVQVDPAMAKAPFDVARQALVPPGWTMKLWARVPKARLAAWTPDGALLVSVPAEGKVVKLTPGATSRESVLLEGLDAPHGLAFAGSTLYVAESDQVDAYSYADGAATGRRVVAAGLPDDSSPELHGAYEHALKSVAVGADGAVYFSIGSTGNVSAEDRSATPERATIMRIAPQGGQYVVFARGVRNGTGLAIAPDGSVWTAVNNRDNIAYPGPGPSYGKVIPDYVDDHPPESFARLTAGRDLGWPYCNPDGVGGPGPAGARRADQSRWQQAGLLEAACHRTDTCRPLCAVGADFRDRRAARAVRAGCAGRCARVVEPPVAAGARSVVLSLAQRHFGRSTNPRRRVPGTRRIAVGPTRCRGAGTRRRGLCHRRRRRRGVPGGAARSLTTRAVWSCAL